MLAFAVYPRANDCRYLRWQRGIGVLIENRSGLTIGRAEPPRDMPVVSTGWFAVWTRARHEGRVLDQLQRKDLEAFLPRVARWSRWKDRKKRVEWPLFPGYCFVRIDPDDTLPVLKCSGVVSVVSSNGRPALIPDVEIDSIRTLVESELNYDPCPLVKIGQMVQVVSGPLKGVVGRLTRKGNHARLVLSVDLIGQGVAVELDAADVRPY
jgi:transcriptional antiterminator NusG